MITIVAKCVLKENCKNKFIETAKELIEESNKEKGCIAYDLYEDINDENVVSFIEIWESKEAIEAHNNSEHFKRIVPKLGELRVGDSLVNLYSKV